MTPILRQQILDSLNEIRSKLENGQLLLNNGKYALQADALSELIWDCEIEERTYNWMKENCIASIKEDPFENNMTWIYNRYNNDNTDTLVSGMLTDQTYFSGISFQQLSRHNLYINPSTNVMKNIFVLSDKAQRIGCAIQHCNLGASSGIQYISNNIYCQLFLTEDIEFGNEIYKISSSANYIPPTQDVICESSVMTVEEREVILEKINNARKQISQGTYQLQNGNIAIQSAQPLSPMLWNCEDEAALTTEKSMSFQCTDINNATEFEKIIPEGSPPTEHSQNELLLWWTQFGTEFFIANPNFNFLSQSTIYSTEYPAAFALSQNAESITCFRKQCWSATTFSITFRQICRAKPIIQINDNLY
uniref:SCP domain-containing protein n=1 Tax=Panagrolaimus sp. PS1159 TaxID=55785 RepID=A0AC35GSL6_9BILA